MHPLFFHCVFLPEISGRSLSDPGQKLPVCCSLPLDFGGRSSLTSSHSENTDSHRLHDPSGKILRNITLLPDIKALPFLPARRRSSTCSLCHLHIPTLSDHSSSIPASEKSASHGKLHGDTLSDHNPSVGITQIRYGRRSIFLSACHTSSRWLFSFLFFNIAHTYPVVKPPLLIALCTPAGNVTVHSVLSNTLRDAQNLC